MSRLVVLITGTTSGLGLETARFLARKGYQVYGSCRDPRKLKALREKEGVLPFIPCFMDVTKSASVSKAVSAILKKEGQIDILVNNAGFVVAGFLEDLSDQDLRDQLNTNVLGMLRVTRAVVPAMRKKGIGKILNIGSISGRVTFPGIGAYAMSKFMVRSLTEGLRQELRPFGIEVAEIAPGSFATQVASNARFGKNAQSPSSPYALFKAQVEKRFADSSQQAAPAEKLAELIWKVLGDRPLRPVYLAGVDAVILNFLKDRLPDHWFEGLLTRLFPWSRSSGGL